MKCVKTIIFLFLILIDNLNGRVDEPLEDNDSALHLACLYGHLPCVQVVFTCPVLCFFISLIANVFVRITNSLNDYYHSFS